LGVIPIPNYFPDYLFSFLIGAFVGLAEILSRYRDAPFQVARTKEAIFYISINGGAAILALWLLRLFNLRVTTNPQVEVVRATQVLIAGFGSLLFFRSSFFVFRLGNQDVFFGPSQVLQVLLLTIDREMDRNRAEARFKIVLESMKDVSFEEAVAVLPTVCIALMRNIPLEDQDLINTRAEALRSSDMPELAKNLALALTLIDIVGDKVLAIAVEGLKLKKELSDSDNGNDE